MCENIEFTIRLLESGGLKQSKNSSFEPRKKKLDFISNNSSFI